MLGSKFKIFLFVLFGVFRQSFGAEAGSKGKSDAKEGGSFQIQATQSKLSTPKAIYFDSGTISNVLDLQLMSVHDGSYLSLFGTASSWQPADTKSSEYRFDTAGFLAGFYRRRDVSGNALALGAFGGGYYPLQWTSEFSNFYQIPRFELGVSLGLNLSIFEVEGRYDYFWPIKKEGKIKIDSITTTLEPHEYSHFSLESRLNLFDFLIPEVGYGVFSASGATINSPLSEKNFAKSSAKYLSAGLAFKPLGSLIAIKIKSNRVYGAKDDRAIEYATGRRAISELTNSYSVSFTGSL
jgi:hypothetical protein